MKIETVDFFYLSMPQVLDIGDGSQDALLVRIRAGGYEGWGECEASPLTSIASYVCPMSHSACKPVKYSLEGKSINSVKDIENISSLVQENSLDLLQANHTLSGIDIALWDLLGKKLNEPVYKLLGYTKSYPKLAYASVLFGDTPEETLEKGKRAALLGYGAVKFGWGPIGLGGLKLDENHFLAAREGVGKDVHLMIDIGTVWKENVTKAKERLGILSDVKAYWLEEPFSNLALNQYKNLSESTPKVSLAGGEGCSNFVQAQAMINYSGVKFIQIDAGRIGGISVAKKVVDLAKNKDVTYVNHTFTSNLSLSASLQSFAGSEKNSISEYPTELKSLAEKIGKEKILPNSDGYINVPDGTGLGVTVNIEELKKYLVDVEIKVANKLIYYTPDL